MKQYFLFIITIILLNNCNNSTEPKEFDSSYNVRVINETLDTINVVIGPKDFGFIAPDDTTDYFSVYMGDNEVYLADTLYDIMGTGTSDPPPPAQCEFYWTYTIYSSVSHSTLADQELTNWDNCW